MKKIDAVTLTVDLVNGFDVPRKLQDKIERTIREVYRQAVIESFEKIGLALRIKKEIAK